MKSKFFLVENHIGKRIRFYRMMRGYSMKNLADFLSISQQQVQKYEKGIDKIRASRLNQISDFLQIPINDFFPRNMRAEDIDLMADDYDVIKFIRKYRIIRKYRKIKSKKAKKAIFMNIDIFVENDI